MHKFLKLLLLMSITFSAPIFALDSTSFDNIQAYEPTGECSLTGALIPVTFDASQTTMTCADKYPYPDVQYVVVGISSGGGTTKTMYCQKLTCDYEPQTTNKVNFYDLPNS